MSSKWMVNAGFGLALSTMLFAGGAMAQDKTSDVPNIDKPAGSQTNAQGAASETEVQTEGAPPKALECQKLAVAQSDGEDLEGYNLYETNAKDYDASELEDGDTFELKIDLLAGGNAMYNVVCQVDAEGKVSYESVEKTSTVKSNPGGA